MCPPGFTSFKLLVGAVLVPALFQIPYASTLLSSLADLYICPAFGLTHGLNISNNQMQDCHVALAETHKCATDQKNKMNDVS